VPLQDTCVQADRTFGGGSRSMLRMLVWGKNGEITQFGEAAGG